MHVSIFTDVCPQTSSPQSPHVHVWELSELAVALHLREFTPANSAAALLRAGVRSKIPVGVSNRQQFAFKF